MDQYTLFVLLSPFGIVIAILLAAFGWRHRHVQAARPLAFTMGGVAAYLFFNTLELVNPTPEGTLFFAQVCYGCIAVLTINWLIFGLVYSNREHWVASPYFRMLWILPAITVVLVFTNSYHHLIWQDYSFLPVTNGYLYMKVKAYGIGFWVFWLQAYTLILVGAGLMVYSSLVPKKKFRMQSHLTVVAALLPLVVNLVYVLHLIPGFNKDYSPLSYAFSGALLAISIFRYRLLDLTPFARTILIDNMADGMLTLDPFYRVVDFNSAAVEILTAASSPRPQIGERISALLPYLQKLETCTEPDLLQTEIHLSSPGGEEFYDLQIRRLRDRRRSEIIGYLAVLHSITDHKKLLQAARKLAEEDPMTGVLNRTRFAELASREIQRPRPGPACCSILMIDVDHFKEYNDSHGHICGDQLLQIFVRQLCGMLRSTDLVGRVGGDEFIILLPDTALTGALDLAERLRSQIAATAMETADYGPFFITISIGVSEYRDRGPDSLETAVLAADKGLYLAKALGRNRACVYELTLRPTE